MSEDIPIETETNIIHRLVPQQHEIIGLIVNLSTSWKPTALQLNKVAVLAFADIPLHGMGALQTRYRQKPMGGKAYGLQRLIKSAQIQEHDRLVKSCRMSLGHLI